MSDSRRGSRSRRSTDSYCDDCLLHARAAHNNLGTMRQFKAELAHSWASHNCDKGCVCVKYLG